jgi:putative nucleotidyltransferase with HDIG domain
VARIGDEEMARRAEELVLKRIDAEDLGLPALPLVAVRCIEILSHADFSVNDLARAIETDPLVAARVVRLANSAARSTLEPARSVIQSVMRLGADELQTLMFEVSARPIFASHDRTISALGSELWSHSVAVALLARALVRKVSGAQPEAAYLAGLLHDVGKPLMAAMLLDAERRLFNVRTKTWLFPATWLALIARAHRRVGIALAQAWRLPPLVVASVRDAQSYDVDDGTKPANAVRLANALAKTAGIYAGEFDEADVADQVFTGRKLFALSEKEAAGLVDGLRARVDERMS